MKSGYEPQTLQEAIVYFASADNCLNYLARKRWPDGVTCPTCGSQSVIFLANQRRWKCRENLDRPQFSVKVGTVMEDSPIGLDKRLTAMWQIVSCKNGISSYEVHRAIGVTQKTAWFLDHRIRFALGLAPGSRLSGQVEAEETFIGGKARNMHRAKRERVVTAVEYVRGEVHASGLENFWSLVKRGLKGTYISVEPFHLFRYLDEQVFRCNNRKVNDGDRFNIVVREIEGKRLTWDQLTGKLSDSGGTPETI
jgi:hypothetical protein